MKVNSSFVECHSPIVDLKIITILLISFKHYLFFMKNSIIKYGFLAYFLTLVSSPTFTFGNNFPTSSNSDKTELIRKKANNIYLDNAIPDANSLNESLQKHNLGSHTLQLFSHGKPGYLFIENSWKNATEIKSWLTKNYDLSQFNHINIYGCEFAKGLEGQKAVTYLSLIHI